MKPLHHYQASYHQQRLSKLGCKKTFAELLAEQDGKCAICNKPFDNLFIDHCHKSNLVRGLLCRLCNNGLGMFQDDPLQLLNAAKYLLSNGRALPRSRRRTWPKIKKHTWKTIGGRGQAWAVKYRDLQNKRRHKNFPSLEEAKAFMESLV